MVTYDINLISEGNIANRRVTGAKVVPRIGETVLFGGSYIVTGI